MGKFDVDDLLKSLGKPNPDAPREPGSDDPKGGAADAGADAGTDSNAENAKASKQTPAAPAKAKASQSATATDTRKPSKRAAAADTAFKRNDPSETPRPPDLSGRGLGTETDGARAVRGTDDPSRTRPQDALTNIGGTNDLVPKPKRGDLLDIAMERGLISTEQLESVRRVIKQSPGKKMSDAMIELGIDETEVQKIVAEVARLPFERIAVGDDDAFDHKYFNRLGTDFCRQHLVMPLRREGNRLVVGTTNPDDVFLLDDVKRRCSVSSIKHVLVTGFDIRGIIELMTESEAEEYDVGELLADVDEDDVEVVETKEEDVTLDDAEASPVVRLVNHIIQNAVKEGASDIHIEAEEKKMKVRFRIDGILFEMMNPPRKMHAALTSRIKIMSNLDIAERRLPQDGRIRMKVLGRPLDLRVSTVPTPKGEKTVMRILDNRSIKVTLDQLGFGEDALTIWKKTIKNPHGIVLVTGPTGSGKTTTLYASLQQLDLGKLNVSTVEDPVEYNLDNIVQIQTHERIGMTFAAALRALLRQDPDVVMVGEIRDLETASIAIQASMTGHLVLSTLHTNDAPSSVTRLVNMGVEPFLAGAAINAVLAQRLARRICSGCGAPTEVTDEVAALLSRHAITPENLRKGTGCQKCRQTGYSGRQGLYELLLLDDFLRDMIAKNPSVTEFRRTCVDRGMVTLRDDGFAKVAIGNTSIEEVLRVTDGMV